MLFRSNPHCRISSRCVIRARSVLKTSTGATAVQEWVVAACAWVAADDVRATLDAINSGRDGCRACASSGGKMRPRPRFAHLRASCHLSILVATLRYPSPGVPSCKSFTRTRRVSPSLTTAHLPAAAIQCPAPRPAGGRLRRVRPCPSQPAFWRDPASIASHPDPACPRFRGCGQQRLKHHLVLLRHQHRSLGSAFTGRRRRSGNLPDRTGFMQKAEACCSLYKRICRLSPASCALQEFRVPGIANGCQRLLVEVVGVAVELAERNDVAVNIG